MASQSPAETSADTAPRLPLFYRDPQPLASSLHADWRLTDGDVTFAADTPFVPIVAGELAAAARCYPIVFAAGDNAPVALLGLELANLFISEGRWTEGEYVPAYVRRYPFGFIATVNPDGFALAVDAGSGRVVREGDAGVALFEDDKPTELTRQALAFCDAFQSDALATRDFSAALSGAGLLIDRRADATLPDGRRFGLEGFRIVDADAFAKLDDATVLDWHRKGWLALVQFHLASLERFQALLALQGKRTAASEAPASEREKPRKG